MYFPSLKDLAIAFLEISLFSFPNRYLYDSTPPFVLFYHTFLFMRTHSQTCTYTAGQFSGISYEQLAGRLVGRVLSW